MISSSMVGGLATAKNTKFGMNWQKDTLNANFHAGYYCTDFSKFTSYNWNLDAILDLPFWEKGKKKSGSTLWNSVGETTGVCYSQNQNDILVSQHPAFYFDKGEMEFQ